MLEEKQMIENKYEVKKKLNNNNLYLVTDLRMMTLWMIKEISWEEISEKCINGENDQEAFVSELEQMKKINHRIFPKVVEILRTEECLYIVMEPVQGEKMFETERKSQREIVTWAIQLCDGLKNVEQMKLPHIKWKHSAEDIRLEDGNIRIQDFDIFPEKEKNLSEEIGEVAEFIRAGGKLKLARKLKSIIQSCISGNEEYETYERLADALERYMMETEKKRKVIKRICSAGAVAVMAAIICFMGAKVLEGKQANVKSQGEVPKPTSTENVYSNENELEGAVKKAEAYAKEVETVLKEKEEDICVTETLRPGKTEIPEAVPTKKPEKTPDTVPKTVKSADVTAKTPEIEKTKEPVKPTARVQLVQPQKTESPSIKITPRPQNKDVTTSKPKEKPKKTKEPQVEIELEDNSMEIIVGE